MQQIGILSNMVKKKLFFEGANISISIFAVFEQRNFYKNSNRNMLIFSHDWMNDFVLLKIYDTTCIKGLESQAHFEYNPFIFSSFFATAKEILWFYLPCYFEVKNRFCFLITFQWLTLGIADSTILNAIHVLSGFSFELKFCNNEKI